MKDEEKDYEWNYDDGNRYRSSGRRYLLYGRYLQNKWGIDPKAKTPAYEMEDGVDYVPADTNVVFGHQFASIAGAGRSMDQSRLPFLDGFRYFFGS